MRKSITLTILVISLSSASLYAANPSFLFDSTPIADFTQEDGDMFWNAITTALDSKKDGEKLAWKNDKTGNSGLVNPISTYRDGDQECRNLRVINRSKKYIAESLYKFCKKEDKWVAMELIE